MDKSADQAWTASARGLALTALQTRASQGHAEAQYDLGAHYYRASLDGRRCEPTESKIEAFKWFHLSAAQGYKDALTLSELVILTMARAEYEEGKRRASAFVAQAA